MNGIAYNRMCVVAIELRKTLMLGNIEGRRRSRQQNEMVGWHHRLNNMRLSKLQETVRDRKAWCCSPWGRKELDMT